MTEPVGLSQRELLAELLTLAVVTIWHEIDAMGVNERIEYGRRQLDNGKYRGFSEALLYRMKTPVRTTDEFVRLARAIAVCAHQPGGIRFLDHHWEAPNPWPHECPGLCERRAS